MALSIQIPTVPSNITELDLTRKLGLLVIPNIIHYIVSFMVVGMYWISYDRIFEHIRRADITLVCILFLPFIALVVYFTGLLTIYDTHRIVIISFSSIMAATGFVLCLIWGYASHNRRLVDQDIPDHMIRYFLNRTFVSPLIFLTIGISFINIQAAQYFLVLILPANIIIYMKHILHLHKL